MAQQTAPTNPVPVEIFHDRLGPRVPLKSNSPNQWIAASGLILRTEVGSTVHGTSIKGQDDVDEMGVCIEPFSTTLGLKRFESYQYRTAEPDGPLPKGHSAPSRPGDLDLFVYSLRKFVTLVCAGNPSLMVPLFVCDDAIRYINEYGKELRDNRGKFLSRQAGPRFKGYLHSQRLGLLGKRNTPTRPQITDGDGKTYDPKYAMHALRLGIQGCELLERGEISIPMRGSQLRFLREVRSGQRTDGQVWPLEYLLSQIERYERQIDKLMETSRLPAEPEWAWINTWLADVHLRRWGYGPVAA